MKTMQTELLSNLTVEELEALAESQLAPGSQAHLDDLLDRHAEKQLSETEIAELDRLLRHADQLMILKTRARFTLANTTAEAVP